MDAVNKRYVHDHVSTYKNREKLGSTNRFVRAHRANEDRKALRLDEITKRRGLVLSLVNECNSFLEENADQKKTTVKTKDKVMRSKTKAKSSSKENVPQPQVTDDRKAMLLKWKEQRELKRKTEAVKKQQKGVFAVRHVQHEKKTFLAPFPTKATRISPKKLKSASVPPAKRVTRSSARLANKQTAVKPADKGRPTSSRKEMPSVKKPVTVNKVEDVPKRVTRQSAKAKTSANTKKVIPEQNEKTKGEEKNEKENNHPVEPEKKATPSKKQQRKSFAPPNFQFTAPSGLYSFEHYSKEFKFQPLSPTSTENFFKGLAPAVPTPENRRQLITKNNFDLRNVEENENPVPMSEETEDQISAANEKDMGIRREENDKQESKEIECEDNKLSSKYFRDLVLSETEKLNLLCKKWEKELESENELPEEGKGSIRTAIGQARLLIRQRFKQFSGLIDLSENEAAEKKATISDLQGFWDMIYFQVEDVHTKMDGLEKQKEKNWIIETKPVKTRAKKTKKNTRAKGVGKKDAKPVAKSKIQEMRAAMRVKMAEKKIELQAENGECTAFITVLTPVKKNEKPGLAENVVVLTPVRRSLRNTPISHSGTPHVTPKVISTPRRFGKKSPGLRLTPEAVSENPHDTGSDELSEEKMENGQESTDEKEKKVGSLSSDLGAQSSDDLSAKEKSSSENTDEDMEKNQKEISPGTKRRSCLRSSTKKKRKSSRVFFKSPRPSANYTAGGTPGSIVFTPEVQGGVWSTAITLTPVAVSFADSPVVKGSTYSINAGHTPAPASDRRRSLRKIASNGTPVRRSSLNNGGTTSIERETFSSDSAPEMSSSPGETHVETSSFVDKETPGRSGSKRRSLQRSCRKITTNEKGDSFLPSKYFFPSSSSEEDGDNTAPAESPFLAGRDLHSNSQSLVTFTPVKDSSNRMNQSSLTPSTMFQALSLNDSRRRDSVFFAPSGSLIDNSQPAQENLICFSPVPE